MSDEEILARVAAEVGPAELPGIGYLEVDEVDPRGMSEDTFREVVGQPIDDRYGADPDPGPDQVGSGRTAGVPGAMPIFNQARELEERFGTPMFTPQSAIPASISADSLERDRSAADKLIALERSRQNQDMVAENEEAFRFKREAAVMAALREGRLVAGGEYPSAMPRASSMQAAETYQGTYIDPTTGNPIAVQGPATNAIAGSNTPNTSQQLNAPTRDSAVDYVAKQINQGQSNERPLYSTDITTATTEFAQAVRDLGEKPGYGALRGVSDNIRSVDELQKAATAIAAMAERQGERLTQPKDQATTGRPEYITGSGVSAVMNKLGLSPQQQQELANALFQMEAAQANPENKRAYRSRSVSDETKQRRRQRVQRMAEDPKFAVEYLPGVGTAPVGIEAVYETVTDKGKKKKKLVRPETTTLPGGSRTPEAIAAGVDAQFAPYEAKGYDYTDRKKEVTGLREEMAARVGRDESRRADQMSAIIASLPPNARRSRLPGRG